MPFLAPVAAALPAIGSAIGIGSTVAGLFGGGSKKSSGGSGLTGQQVAQSSIDPRVMQMYQQNYNRALGVANQPFKPWTGDYAAGLSGLQQQGMGLFGDIATNRTGSDTLAAAKAGMSGILNTPLPTVRTDYGPHTINERFNAPQINQTFSARDVADPMMVRSNYQAGNIRSLFDAPTIGAREASTDYRAPEIKAGLFSDIDINKYLNPQTQSVVDAYQKDSERARQIALLKSAPGASAFGGSRHGVADSLTNREWADSNNATLAGLRSGAFDKAAALATGDLDRRLQADTQTGANFLTAQGQRQAGDLTNVQRDITLGQTNAGNNLQAQSLGLQGQIAGEGFRQAAGAMDLGAQTTNAGNQIAVGQMNQNKDLSLNSMELSKAQANLNSVLQTNGMNLDILKTNVASAIEADRLSQNGEFKNLDAALQKQGLNLQTLQAQTGLSAQELASAISQAQGAMNAGAVDQETRQRELLARADEHWREQQYPMLVQQMLNNSLNGMPFNRSVTEQYNPGLFDKVQGGIGAVGQLNDLFGDPLGGLFGNNNYSPIPLNPAQAAIQNQMGGGLFNFSY